MPRSRVMEWTRMVPDAPGWARKGKRLMHPSEDVHGRYYWCGSLPECPEE